MSHANVCQAALFIGGEEGDDVVILIVGGDCGTGKEAKILTSRPRRTRGDRSNGGNQWRWQQLSPMQRGRPNRPGMLRLGKECVLVVGGSRNIRSTEVLQLPRGDNDRGVWTLLRETMTQQFGKTFLVNFNNRILAFGKFFI